MRKVIFDGEITNHNELCRNNNISQSLSNEELVIQLYEKKGIDFVCELEGRYSIVICEGKQKYLVRDKLGYQPMYYTIQNQELYYGSSLKTLVLDLPQMPQLDSNAIYQYLSFWALPSDLTWFKGVKKVEPGHYILFDDGITKKNYYDVSKFINAPNDDDKQAAQAKIENILMDYFKMRNGDYYLALSGGVDSCLLAIIGNRMNRISHSISVYLNDNSDSEEITRINRVKDYFYSMQMQFKACIISSTTVRNMARLIPQETLEPMQLMDMIIIWKIMEGKEGTYLFGEGADELGGYLDYIRNNEINSILKARKRDKVFDRYYKDNYITSKHIVGMSEKEKKYIWKGEECINSYEYISTLYGQISNDFQDSYYRKLQNVDFKFRLPEYLLKRTEIVCRILQTRTEFPFLNSKLVEYCLKINKSTMMNGDEVKSIFRNILQKFVPMKLWEGKKLGMGDGLNEYLNSIVLNNYINEIEVKEDHPIFQYLDRERIGEMVRQNNNVVWSIYALGMWIEQLSDEVYLDTVSWCDL